jgi:hypothetical protein
VVEHLADRRHRRCAASDAHVDVHQSRWLLDDSSGVLGDGLQSGVNGPLLGQRRRVDGIDPDIRRPGGWRRV